MIIDDTDNTMQWFCNPDELFVERDQPISSEMAYLIDDYERKNSWPQKLTKSFTLDDPYSLIRLRELQDIGPHKDLDSWDRFQSKYPKPVIHISLSRVGFDAQKRKAVVYVAEGCGLECGMSRLILLEKESEKWVIKDQFVCGRT